MTGVYRWKTLEIALITILRIIMEIYVKEFFLSLKRIVIIKFQKLIILMKMTLINKEY